MSTQQLHQGLIEDGHYTKSLQEFQVQFQTKDKQLELYNGIVGDGDFTGSFIEFQNKFFPTQAVVTTPTSTPTSTSTSTSKSKSKPKEIKEEEELTEEIDEAKIKQDAIDTEYWDKLGGKYKREHFSKNEEKEWVYTNPESGETVTMEDLIGKFKGEGLVSKGLRGLLKGMHNELNNEDIRVEEAITGLKTRVSEHEATTISTEGIDLVKDVEKTISEEQLRLEDIQRRIKLAEDGGQTKEEAFDQLSDEDQGFLLTADYLKMALDSYEIEDLLLIRKKQAIKALGYYNEEITTKEDCELEGGSWNGNGGCFIQGTYQETRDKKNTVVDVLHNGDELSYDLEVQNVNINDNSSNRQMFLNTLSPDLRNETLEDEALNSSHRLDTDWDLHRTRTTILDQALHQKSIIDFAVENMIKKEDVNVESKAFKDFAYTIDDLETNKELYNFIIGGEGTDGGWIEQSVEVDENEIIQNHIAKTLDEHEDVGFFTKDTEHQKDIRKYTDERLEEINPLLKEATTQLDKTASLAEDVFISMQKDYKWLGENNPQHLIDDIKKKIKNKEYTSQEEYDKDRESVENSIAEYNNVLNSYLRNQKILGATNFSLKEQQVTTEALMKDVEQLSIVNDKASKYYGELYNWSARIFASTAEFAIGIDELLERMNPALLLDVEDVPDWMAPGLKFAHENNVLNSLSPLHGARPKLDDISNHLRGRMQDYSMSDNIFEYTAMMIAEMAPQMIVGACTGGMGNAAWMVNLPLMSAAAAGNNFMEYEEQGLTGWELYSTALVHGSLEGLSEMIFMNQTKGVFGRLMAETVETGAKQTGKEIFKQSIKKSLGFAGYVGKEGIEEGLSEAANMFAGNAWDKYVIGKDVSIWEGVDKSFIDGFLISGGMKSPLLVKAAVKPFLPKGVSTKLGENSDRILYLQGLLSKSDLSQETIESYEQEMAELVVENNKIFDNSIKKTASIDPVEKQRLIDIEVEKYNLQKKSKAISEEEGLTDEEIKKENDLLNNKWSKLANEKAEILNKYEFTQEELDQKYNDYVDEIKRQRDEHFERTGREIEINELTSEEVAEKTLEAQAEIQAEIDENQRFLDDPSVDAETKGVAQKNIDSYTAQLNDLQSAHEQFGFIGQNPKTGKQIININKETSLAQGGRITTAAHEFLHAVLFKTIGKDAGIQARLGSALTSFMNKKGGVNQEFINRMQPYVGAQNMGEEMITIMSESIMDGTLKFDEGLFTKVGDILRRFLQKKGWKKIKFDNGRHVYNFIKDYNHSIENKYTNKAISEVMDKGAKGKLVEGPKKGGAGVSYSKANNLQQMYADTYKGDKVKLIEEGLSIDKEGNKVKDTELDKSILGEGMAKIAGRITKRLFDPIPVSERAGITRSMYMNELLKLAGEMIRNEYDPTKQSLDRFVSNRLNARANSLAKDIGVKQQFTESIDDPSIKGELTTDPVDLTETVIHETMDGKPSMADKLIAVDPELQIHVDETRTNIDNGLDMLLSNEGMLLELQDPNLDPETKSSHEQQVEANNAELEILGMKDFDITKQDYKSLKDLSPETTQRMFGIVPKVGNLTQPDTRNSQMFIDKHAEGLAGALPQGHTVGSTSTGVNQVLLKEFYNKRSVRAKTGPGLNVQFKKPMSAIMSTFRSVFGITERGNPNLYKKESNTSARIKALVSQTGKIMSNQMVREYLVKTGHMNAKLNVAMSDGKSDLMFSKNNNVSQENIDRVVDIMNSNDVLGVHPHEAVKIAAETYNVPVKDFGNLADVFKNKIDDNVSFLDQDTYAKVVPENVTPETLENNKNWAGYIKGNNLNRYAPLDKNNPKDKATFIAETTSFLSKLPTAWLKNQTLKTIFANGTQGDFFHKMEELDSVIDRILENRKKDKSFVEPIGGELVTKGLKFDAKLMDNIIEVSLKYENSKYDGWTKERKVREISKEVANVVEKSGSNPADLKAGVTFVMNQLNSYFNEPGLTVKQKDIRGKFITSLLQNQTSKAGGIIRGSAFFKMLSLTGGKTQFKYKMGGGISSTEAGIGGALLRDVYGFKKPMIKLIGQKGKPSVSSKYRLKGESEKQAIQRLEKAIESQLTPIAEDLGYTYKEYREMLHEGMSFLKSHHGEHIIALLSMTTNSFSAMVDGTFDSKFPDIIRYYDQMALNEDMRIIIDQYFKTGMPDNFFFGMNPFVRMTTVMPDIASETIIWELGTTMDRAIAAELMLTQIEKGEFTPIVSKIKNASTTQELNIINKNQKTIAGDPDLQSGFNNVIHEAANETYFSKDPKNTSRAVKNLVNNINNISKIKKQKNKNVKSYDLLNKDMTVEQQNDLLDNRDEAISFSRKVNPSKGMSVWDFDDTIAKSKSNVLFTTPDGANGKLNAEQYASQYVDLAAKGYEFDFSEFNEVVEGQPGPLFQDFVDRIKKFGVEDNYILTARPAEAAPAIQEFLQSQGLEIPLENITGLANSTPEAKALWITEKVSDGYNNIFFADDALQNVQTVKNVLNQFDIKSEVQQAKIQFSKSIDPEFNNVLNGNVQAELDLNRVLEQTKGVKAEARYSDAQAKVQGSKKGKWKFWIPPSAEDFKGLVYRFIGKGRIGEQQMAFFKKALFDPFSRAYEAMNNSKQRLEGEYRALLKEFPSVKSILNSVIYNNFTLGQMVRVYNWNKAGFEIPGLAQRDLDAIIKEVEGDADTLAFAKSLSIISNQEAGYTQPGDFWMVENIQSDINKINNEIDRAYHLKEWKQNIETMFGKWENGRLVGPNMNKIEAIYGTKFREALEDMVWRMEFGSKRQQGSNRLVNAFNNWANQSVGAIMFLNMRSALLQTISSINYLNWSDNNPLKAGLALANAPQFIKDFSMIFNSDMLKQRRAGNQRGINEAELAEAVAGSNFSPKAILHYLLTKGFLPTQIADSFAIASGGATFYRNRVNSLLKQGMTQEQAESRAWQDFQENTEESQQSSRPDMISQQQASPLGRYILAFKNTPMQYARLMKKAWLDIANGRGDFKTNLGKIIYYGAVQNLIFSGLQAAMGAMLGDDDEEKDAKAHERVVNSMIDSILGGLGFGGNAVLTLKNTLLEYIKQDKKGWTADHTYTILKFFGFSPTVGSKGRKLYSAIQGYKFNEDVIKEMSMLDIDNPRWSVIANLVSALTNIPLDRLIKKIDNIDAALTEDITAAQRLALLMGWNTWDLDIDDSDVVAVEDEIKEKKKIETEEKKKIKKEEKKIKVKEENKLKEEENKKKKDGGCIAIGKSGERCKNEAESGGYCTVHAKVEQGTKEVQCKKIKSNKKRCKMKTKAKSGYCYYHD